MYSHTLLFHYFKLITSFAYLCCCCSHNLFFFKTLEIENITPEYKISLLFWPRLFLVFDCFKSLNTFFPRPGMRCQCDPLSHNTEHRQIIQNACLLRRSVLLHIVAEYIFLAGLSVHHKTSSALIVIKQYCKQK